MRLGGRKGTGGHKRPCMATEQFEFYPECNGEILSGLSSLFYFRKLILGVIEKLDWRDGGEGGRAEEQRPVRGLLQRVRWDMRSAWTQAVVSACRSEKGFQVLRKQKWRDADYPENMAFFINTLKNWSKCDLSTIKAVHILYLQINTNPIHVFEVDNYHC